MKLFSVIYIFGKVASTMLWPGIDKEALDTCNNASEIMKTKWSKTTASFGILEGRQVNNTNVSISCEFYDVAPNLYEFNGK